jgi:hypothetical protein
VTVAPETLEFLREKAKRHRAQERDELAILDEIQVLSEWLEGLEKTPPRDQKTMLYFRTSPNGGRTYFGSIVRRKIVETVKRHIEDEIAHLKELP